MITKREYYKLLNKYFKGKTNRQEEQQLLDFLLKNINRLICDLGELR